MVKSETTIRRELKAVRDRLNDKYGLSFERRDELRAVRATLQWALGKHNVRYSFILSGRQNESRRPVAWVTDRSGSAVE